MARKFITSRELSLINKWSRELIQGTAEQEIVYYAISSEESRVHDVYDEAVYKEYLQPIRINARVEWQQTATTTGGGTADSTYSCKVWLHHQECVERNIVPREGDFIEFGQIVFEITTATWAKPAFGQMNAKLEHELTCVSSREGQFKAENVREDEVDNTHPVETARPRTLGDDL